MSNLRKKGSRTELTPTMDRIGNVAAAIRNDEVVIYSQVFTNAATYAGGNTYSGANTFSGNNTHSGTETFTNAAGVTTNTVTPATAGLGTSTQSPTSQGQAFASPVTLTAADSGKLCISDAAAGTKWILPAATAANTGVWFKFYVSVTVTSNSLDVEGATASDLMVAGSNITQIKGTATPTVAYYSPNGTTNFKVTMNGGTTGGLIGDYFIVTCLGLNKWLVTGQTQATGTVATPFAG